MHQEMSQPAHPLIRPSNGYVKTRRPKEGIVDLYAPNPEVLELLIQGETLWATRCTAEPRRQGPAVCGPRTPGFCVIGSCNIRMRSRISPLLQSCGAMASIMYLLHMLSANEQAILEEAEAIQR